jgi:hypothetical protein
MPALEGRTGSQGEGAMDPRPAARTQRRAAGLPRSRLPGPSEERLMPRLPPPHMQAPRAWNEGTPLIAFAFEKYPFR